MPEYLPFPHATGQGAGEEREALEYRVPTAGVETAQKLMDQRSVPSNELFVGVGEGVRPVRKGEGERS